MLDELVVLAQAARIENAELVHHDGVLERTALSEPHAAKHLHVLHETERAGARDRLLVRDAREVDVRLLLRAVDRRMTEGDGERETKALVRLKPCKLVALANLDGLEHPHEALGRVLLDDARLVKQEDEARPRAIHDRNLGGVNLDDHIVDAETVEGAHQMLYGRHGGLADVDRRGHARVVHVEGMSGNLDGGTNVHAPVENARVGFRGAKHEVHLAAAVKPDPDGLDGLPERALLEHE